LTVSHTDRTDHVRGSSLLLGGRVFSILVNMGFQVVLVRYLSRSDYGVVAYGLAIASAIQILVSLGQERSVSRFVVLYEEQGRPDRVLGTLVLYVLSVSVLGLLAFVGVVLFSGPLTGGLDNKSAAAVLSILVLVAPLDSLDMMLQATFAAFSQTKRIFFRKYVLSPVLKLTALLAVVLTHQSVKFVAATVVVTSLVGVVVYLSNLPKTLKERGIWRSPVRANIDLPTRDVLWFAVPLLSSPLVWTAFGLGSSTALAWWYDSAAIADFRSVWSAARLNMVVSSTFGVLFLPSFARLVVQGDGSRINSAYWRTSAWVAALTIPVFLATVPLAHGTTVLLFGERYAGSATVLAVVSFGIYVDVVFGFNRQTLELYGRVWTVVASDVSTIIVNLALVLALVPDFGPNGAAIATTVALVARNLFNQLLVVRLTPVSWFDLRYMGVYASVIVGWAALELLEWAVAPPLLAAYVVAAAISLAALRLNRRPLAIADTFPELVRVPLLGRLLT
jgi:O-antigen/teichoic acid export membrane protein